MSVLASTSRESSDISVTCFPAFLWAALNSLKFSTKFCRDTLKSLVFCHTSPTASVDSAWFLHETLHASQQQRAS